jgi:hypothetical protein
MTNTTGKRDTNYWTEKAQARYEEIRLAWDETYRRTKASLIVEVEQNHRIIDTRGMDKQAAAWYVMAARFGRELLSAWSDLPKPRKTSK